MTYLIEENFDELVGNVKGTSLVYVGAVWCGPCKQISPIVEALSNEATDYKVYKVDADNSGSILQKTGVRSIPTILVYKDGEIVDRHVGVSTKENLDALAKKYL